jgi:hypothetical protein
MTAELYDPAAGAWRGAPPMTAARYFHTATLLRDGRVLVAGGFQDDVPTLASAEMYGNADAAPPVTTATASPAPNRAGWNRTAVSVTLRAVDQTGGSGVAELTYRATGAQPISTTTVHGGLVTITLRRQGTTTRRSFTIHVAGAAEQVVALRAELAPMAIPERAARRLDRDLARAQRALRRHRPRRACARLHTFLRHVDRYDSNGTLTAVDANRLRAAASRIMRVVPCDTGDGRVG